MKIDLIINYNSKHIKFQTINNKKKNNHINKNIKTIIYYNLIRIIFYNNKINKSMHYNKTKINKIIKI